MRISRSIVDRIREDGEFLEKKTGTLSWHAVADRRALEKTAQALRDGAAPIRKRLIQDMGDPAFLDAVIGEGGSAAGPSSDRRSPPAKGRKRCHKHKLSMQRKKLRRKKLDPLSMKAESTPSPDKLDPSNPLEQIASLGVERSTRAPVREIVCIAETEPSSLHASHPHQRHESAEQQHMAHLPRHTPQNRLSFTEISSVVSIDLPAEISFSNCQSLTQDAPDDDDYAPLPLMPVHGESNMVISTEDILQAVEILSNTGTLSMPMIHHPTMVQYREPLINDNFLKVAMDDDWLGVPAEWQPNTVHDWG